MLEADYPVLHCAWENFRKGKRPNRAIDEFAYNLENTLHNLCENINNRTYKHGAYQKIVITEKKRRDLAIASVRDRIVHRYVYDRLVNIYDKSFDPDVWSCRKNKGLHICLSRTQKLLQKYPNSYVWRADIIKFFDNVKHDKLLALIGHKLFAASELFWLCEQIINSYYRNNNQLGIPIGNITSQIFSNIYLNEFDRYVRHKIKPQVFMRYGDDFVLFTTTRNQAYKLRKVLISWLDQKLNLSINPKNDVVIAANQCLKFLGHDITDGLCLVDMHTTESVLAKVNLKNLSSYQSLNLPPAIQAELYWLSKDEVEKIFD